MADLNTIKTFPESDRDWTEQEWNYLVEYIVDNGVNVLILGRSGISTCVSPVIGVYVPVYYSIA